MNDQTVTRRAALRTGGLAAIAASLLGTTTTAPSVAAQTPPPLPWLGSISAPDLANMTAESQRLHDLCRETLIEAARLNQQLSATLTPEQDALSDVALGEHYGATLNWYMSELRRHLPGIAPALLAVWEHVREELTAGSRRCFPDPTGGES